MSGASSVSWTPIAPSKSSQPSTTRKCSPLPAARCWACSANQASYCARPYGHGTCVHREISRSCNAETTASRSSACHGRSVTTPSVSGPSGGVRTGTPWSIASTGTDHRVPYGKVRGFIRELRSTGRALWCPSSLQRPSPPRLPLHRVCSLVAMAAPRQWRATVLPFSSDQSLRPFALAPPRTLEVAQSLARRARRRPYHPVICGPGDAIGEAAPPSYPLPTPDIAGTRPRLNVHAARSSRDIDPHFGTGRVRPSRCGDGESRVHEVTCRAPNLRLPTPPDPSRGRTPEQAGT